MMIIIGGFVAGAAVQHGRREDAAGMMRREDCIAGAAAGWQCSPLPFCEDAAYDTRNPLT